MTDSGSQSSFEELQWNRLSDRQRDVMDLLLERKTSKQIARELNIAKDTVDQRITSARNILGAADRNEAALAYARLKSIYDRVAYDPVVVGGPAPLVPSDFPDDEPANALKLSDAKGVTARGRSLGAAFKDLGRHDHDAVGRAWIYVATIVLLIFLALGGLGIAQALTQLVSR